MLFYFDSSAMVKRYVSEKGSEWVESIFEPTAENTVHLAQIGTVEVAAALSKKVRTRELTPEEYEAELLSFLADVQNEEYEIIQLSSQIVDLAVDLTKRYPLRAYDAVHLATAIITNADLLAATLPPLIFISADSVLCGVARGEGLSVDNPNGH